MKVSSRQTLVSVNDLELTIAGLEATMHNVRSELMSLGIVTAGQPDDMVHPTIRDHIDDRLTLVTMMIEDAL